MQTASKQPHQLPWYRTTFTLSMLGGLLLWSAFPPLGWWPMALVAPVCWLALARQPQLPGKRPWWSIMLAAQVHWMLLFHFIRLPHWSAYFGWVALGIYLSCYTLAFIALTRVAVHRLRIDLVISAPIVWVGLELIRGHLFTGFSMGLLGHTLFGLPVVIQIADLAGAYAVSFVVMFVAAALARSLPDHEGRWRAWPVLPAMLIVAATLVYGVLRVGPADETSADQARVALIQGCIDTTFPDTEEEAEEIQRRTYLQYRDLTLQAMGSDPDLDLIVWPETVFTIPYANPIEDEMSHSLETVERVRQSAHYFRQYALLASGAITPDQLDLPIAPNIDTTPMLVGVNTFDVSPQHHYNSALFLDSQAKVQMHYHKMHPVVFGEYVPLGDVFPILYRLTPMASGLTCGTEPQAVDVNGLSLMPSICFESLVPHLVRRKVNHLETRGTPVDVLVNLTNDGWFWGSSALDLHLAGNVFRAVELRRPMLVAANTGFSAWISGDGRILKRGPRRDTGILIADVRRDARTSPYQWLGDWPALVCAACCLIFALAGLGDWWRGRTKSQPSTTPATAPVDA